jgi:hypothetical protein
MSDKGLFSATLLAAVVAAVLVYLPDPEFENVSPAGNSDSCAPVGVPRIPRVPSRNEEPRRIYIVGKSEEWHKNTIPPTDTTKRQ